jgi:hypothetical protein
MKRETVSGDSVSKAALPDGWKDEERSAVTLLTRGVDDLTHDRV